jgi:hypothetical protein
MQLSDEHIAFILADIKANGIVIEDLQNNLLDHICCIVENEMPEGEDFYKFYGCIMPRFFKKDLKEIEEETNNLLTFKNYYAMKSTVKISGIISAFLILGGSIFKTMHWPGAGFMIMLGGLFFSLIFVPLMIVLKFKDDETTTDKWVFAFGFLLAMVAALGIIFKAAALLEQIQIVAHDAIGAEIVRFQYNTFTCISYCYCFHSILSRY